MAELFNTLANIVSQITSFVVPIFVVLLVMNVGLSQKIEHLIQTVKEEYIFLIIVVLYNYIVVPFLISQTVQILDISTGLADGMLLLALTSGAPISVAIVKASGYDPEVTGVTMLALVIGLIITIPINFPLYISGAQVPVGQLIQNLLLNVFLPLAIGIAITYFKPEWTATLKKWIGQINGILMNIVIYGNILVSLPDIIDLIGQGVIIYTLVMMVIIFIIGYLVTYNSEKDHRITAAFMSAMPNAGISILLANSAFNDPDTLLMVIIGGNLINLALVWIAKWINNREQA